MWRGGSGERELEFWGWVRGLLGFGRPEFGVRCVWRGGRDDHFSPLRYFRLDAFCCFGGEGVGSCWGLDGGFGGGVGGGN